MRDYPTLEVNTPEQDAAFLSIYVQRDPSQKWGVCLAPLVDDRSEAQNSLMWHWNREVAKQSNLSNDWVHGDSKLNVLLPLMKGWGKSHLKRANFIQDVIDLCAEYKVRVGVAYDMVRTRKLGIKHMTEYLNEYHRHYSSNGIFLTNSDDYGLAMRGEKNGS